MDLLLEEKKVIKELFKNKRTKSNFNMADAIYDSVEMELKESLKINQEDLQKILNSLERKGLIVVYFDCEFVNLSDSGENLAKDL